MRRYNTLRHLFCFMLAFTMLFNAHTVSFPKESNTIEEDKFIQSSDSNDFTFSNEFPELEWWESFDDEYLSCYIKQALENNKNIKVALNRVLEARQIARQSLGQELPQISLTPSFTRQKSSENLTRPSNNQLQSGGAFTFFPGTTLNIYNVPLSASYEADIWLKNRNETQALSKLADATAYDLKNITLIVASEIANTYLSLIATDKLIQTQQNIIDKEIENLQLLKSQLNSGLITSVEVNNQEKQILTAESALKNYELQQSILSHQLVYLLGESTAKATFIERGSIDNIKVPTTIFTGIPSELLLRRPDILMSEAQLKESKIQISIARKNFLPTIDLSGQFGYSSTKLSNLFDWKSNIANFTASLVQSLFSGGSKKANLKAKKYKYEQMLHTYQDTIMNAFRETEDSIASLKKHYAVYQNTQNTYNIQQETFALTEDRYKAGLIAYNEVNNASTQLDSVKQSVYNDKLQCLQDLISIYKAVGGGF